MKRMNMKRLLILVVLVVIGLLLLSVALVQSGENRNFRAHLSGSNEVPAVNTQAQGHAIFQLSKDGSSLHYKLIVANIDDVFAAHIHCAPAGQNGPIGVTLFGGAVVTINGILAEDDITAPNEGNACGWDDLEDVVSAIQSGGAYVNVHTNANPGGEIRGQVH
jgi:hypothetical protein